jgi:hypothetical protein
MSSQESSSSRSWPFEVEDPLAEEPLAEEPLAEEPLAEEPLAEEPLAEEPLAEEPLAEEPLAPFLPSMASCDEKKIESLVKEEVLKKQHLNVCSWTSLFANMLTKNVMNYNCHHLSLNNRHSVDSFEKKIISTSSSPSSPCGNFFIIQSLSFSLEVTTSCFVPSKDILKINEMKSHLPDNNHVTR